MNKFLVMVILKPDIREKRIDSVQSNILNLFEQNSKVKKVWYLGKRKLDFKNKRYTEGIYLKLDILAHSKKVEHIRQELRKNQDIVFSIIMNNDIEKQNKLSKLKINKLPLCTNMSINNLSMNENSKKIYMLIKQNTKLPFTYSNIIAISEDKNKLSQFAIKKIQEYIFTKGYHTVKNFKRIKDIEKEFDKNNKMQFILDNNTGLGQELIIKEKYLI